MKNILYAEKMPRGSKRRVKLKKPVNQLAELLGMLEQLEKTYREAITLMQELRGDEDEPKTPCDYEASLPL